MALKILVKRVIIDSLKNNVLKTKPVGLDHFFRFNFSNHLTVELAVNLSNRMIRPIQHSLKPGDLTDSTF